MLLNSILYGINGIRQYLHNVLLNKQKALSLHIIWRVDYGKEYNGNQTSPKIGAKDADCRRAD